MYGVYARLTLYFKCSHRSIKVTHSLWHFCNHFTSLWVICAFTGKFVNFTIAFPTIESNSSSLLYHTEWVHYKLNQTNQIPNIFLIPLSRYICLSVCLIIFHPSFFHPLCILFPFIFAHISVFVEHIIRPKDCILYHLSLHRAYLWDIFIPNDGHYKNFIIFLQAKPSYRLFADLTAYFEPFHLCNVQKQS